eukprot:TRINITY_DN13080_c0_g1_i2.p1 TRINITY_DN13080_c0_g1~~TRINITY_DN13080_c0_g1_i2.p1  ORF type:complete len:237 (-),score=70.08 TRINITY_DN13080_c0_g1_i2:21-731(-)
MGPEQNHMFQMIKKGDLIWKGPHHQQLSKEAKDLVHHMMDPNQYTRYTIDQCLEHPWLQQKQDGLRKFSQPLSEAQRSIKHIQANKKLKQVGNVIQQFNKLQRISATPNYPAPINICPSPTFQPIITTTVITPMVTPPPPEPIELTLELPITTTTTVTVAKPEANPLQNKEMFALDHHHHHPYQSSKDLRYLQSRQRLLRVFLEENVIEQSVFVLEMQHLEDVVTYTQCREKASEE